MSVCCMSRINDVERIGHGTPARTFSSASVGGRRRPRRRKFFPQRDVVLSDVDTILAFVRPLRRDKAALQLGQRVAAWWAMYAMQLGRNVSETVVYNVDAGRRVGLSKTKKKQLSWFLVLHHPYFFQRPTTNIGRDAATSERAPPHMRAPRTLHVAFVRATDAPLPISTPTAYTSGHFDVCARGGMGTAGGGRGM